MRIFGFEVNRADRQVPLPSIATPVSDDGAVNIAALPRYSDSYVDMLGLSKSERETITKYREISLHPELSAAIDDIVNEMLMIEFNKPLITMNLDKLQLDPEMKQLLQSEFQNVLSLMNFNKNAFDVLRRWYIDGRIYFHILIDEDNPQGGMLELRMLDPRKIKLIREMQNQIDPETQAMIKIVKDEYFVYDDSIAPRNSSGPYYDDIGTTPTRISKDSVIFATSGIVDEDGRMVLSHLHQAVKPLNQLRMLEDSAVIYRLARGPERRMFHVHVGNMPAPKVEQYMQNVMTQFRNRVVYDATSGALRDDRKMMTMVEDFWFPKYGDGKSTEVTTLPGGTQLGEMTDIEYFKQRLYNALNIPLSRMSPNTPYVLGRATEISRDEIKFQKFVSRLRKRFSSLFEDALEKQFALKGLMSPEQWKDMNQHIDFEFNKDNFFAELKRIGLLQEQVMLVGNMDALTRSYFSKHYVRKNVLNMTDEEIEQIDNEHMIEMQHDMMVQAEMAQLEVNAGFQPNPAAEN